MITRDAFVNQNVKLVKKNHFCLFGVVMNVDDHGVLLQTEQRTSFIAWDEILEIVPRERRDR